MTANEAGEPVQPEVVERELSRDESLAALAAARAALAARDAEEGT